VFRGQESEHRLAGPPPDPRTAASLQAHALEAIERAREWGP